MVSFKGGDGFCCTPCVPVTVVVREELADPAPAPDPAFVCVMLPAVLTEEVDDADEKVDDAEDVEDRGDSGPEAR